MKIRLKYITLLLLLLSGMMKAQNLKFVHYSPEDEESLSNGTVNKIMQDKMGFIWIGTEDGINRFNGYKFDYFKYNPDDTNSISDNKIHDIIEDKDGNLWFATFYGLNKYNPRFNKFYRYIRTDANKNAPADNSIRCMVEDEKTLWIGTDKGGLNSLNFETGSFYSYLDDDTDSLFRVKEITVLAKGHGGSIWIGTKFDGLFLYDRLTGEFHQFYFHYKDDQYEGMKNWITAFFEDSKGNQWVGTRGGGINLFRGSELIDITGYYDYSTPINKNKNWIRDIAEDLHGQVWVATKNGLTKIDNLLNRKLYYELPSDFNPFSISSANLTDLFIDISGSLWVGNYDVGLDVVHNTIVNFKHYKKTENANNSLPGNIVLSLYQNDPTNVYIGTTAGGLSILNRKHNTFHHLYKNYPELNKPVLSVHIDKNNIIWMGTWGKGLQKLDRDKARLQTYEYDADNPGSISNNTILSLYEDNRNNLWIGTFNGLNRFNKRTEQFEYFKGDDGLTSEVIYYITGNGEDTLWIGTRGGGLNIFNVQTKKFHSFMFNPNDSNSISNNVVNYIYDDKKGHLWLSTEVGLNRFDMQSQSFLRITEKDGLPNNRLYGILEDAKGNLWISSNYGICKYTPDNSGRTKGEYRNYTKADGLQSNEFTQTGHFMNTETGEMFFGGVNGFNCFYPSKLVEKDYVAPVRLISFKKMDKEADFKGDTTIAYKKDIKVSWRENFISFEFVGLDYTDPQKNIYSYKMEGLDRSWSKPSKRNYAAYPNIQDGEFIFKVRAANNEGIWNNEGLQVHVTVNPPFWRTKWFIYGSIVIIILAVILYIRIRTKRLEQEKRILEETVAIRTAELRQKNEDITSSIQYAKRIQMAILPTFQEFYDEFPNSFILYKPKDIVSGDFFWYSKVGKRRLFAAADCTGHGVPGAFMSIIGNNLLEKIVNKGILNPSEILEQLDKDIVKALDQHGRRGDSFDGMDIALCTNDEGSMLVEYAGAYRPLIHISGRDVKKIIATKRSIGGAQKLEKKKFVTHKVELKKGDIIYAFSDGYADQFGGARGRKFMMKNLQYELANIHHFPMNEQGDYLGETIDIYMNNYSPKYEQVDDILIFGVQF